MTISIHFFWSHTELNIAMKLGYSRISENTLIFLRISQGPLSAKKLEFLEFLKIY